MKLKNFILLLFLTVGIVNIIAQTPNSLGSSSIEPMGTVTSVGLTVPSGFSVTGSPITSSGTLGITGVLNPSAGGIGISSYTIGDILYASGTTTLAKLANVATGNSMLSGGVGVAPSWGKIGLTTHISGILPIANGGTGASTLNGLLLVNGNTNAAEFDFGTNDAFGSNWEYNTTKGLRLGATGRLFTGTLTDVILTPSDSAKISATTIDLAGAVKITGNTTHIGHILFTDNTYDIGASGATRPRTGYFGTSVVVPNLAYDATTWNGNTTVPTRDDVRDKIESLTLSGDNLGNHNATQNLDLNQFNIIDLNKITADSADIDVFMGTTKFNGAININSNNINNAAQVNADSCEVLNGSFQNAPTFQYQNYTTTGTLNRELAHYWDGTSDDTLTTSSVLPDETPFFVKNNDVGFTVTILAGSGHTLNGDGRIYPGEGCWFQRHGTVIERITPFRHDYRGDLSPTTDASGDFTVTHNLNTTSVVYSFTPICDVCRYSFRRKTTSGITSNTIVVRVYDEITGLPVASTSLSVSVIVQRIN